jgi:hypothetical protein
MEMTQKILLPIIRQALPSLLAKQIVGVQPMSAGAGSVFNKAIGGHNFNAKYWPHFKMVSWDQLFEAERWCYANFKSRNWRNQGMYFAFKREQDYLLFVLKWS